MDAKPTKEVLSPIYTRLEDEQSLLRRSGDVSMLAQAILDTGKLLLTTWRLQAHIVFPVVDLAIEVSRPSKMKKQYAYRAIGIPKVRERDLEARGFSPR